MDANDNDLDIDHIATLKATEIKEICRNRLIPVSGTKSELIQKLRDYKSKVMARAKADVDEDALLADDKPKAAVAPKKAVQKSPVAKVTPSAVAATPKTNGTAPATAAGVKRAATDDSPVKSSDTAPTEAKVAAVAEKSANEEMSEEDKKKKRAEKFGLQDSNGIDKLQKRSEKFGEVVSTTLAKEVDSKKIQQRAERFGNVSAPTTNASDTKPVLSSEEEEKRRKRAERFGIDLENSKNAPPPTDEAKQKRIERFGNVGKTSAAPTTVVDDPEIEEKKRKRAEKFGLITAS